jgi:hypothetical protein
VARQKPSIQKWSRWLARLRDEVLGLYLYRTTWRAIIKAAEDNPNVPRTHVFNFMANTYSASQAVAIRRICGEQSEEVSFRNLLHEVAENPALLQTKLVDVAMVQADIRSLDSGNLRLVRKYVSQYVAHGQETRPAPVPTFADLHAAIDELGSLLKQYISLIDDVDQLLDISIAGDWMAPFRIAWLPPIQRRVGRDA